MKAKILAKTVIWCLQYRPFSPAVVAERPADDPGLRVPERLRAEVPLPEVVGADHGKAHSPGGGPAQSHPGIQVPPGQLQVVAQGPGGDREMEGANDVWACSNCSKVWATLGT